MKPPGLLAVAGLVAALFVVSAAHPVAVWVAVPIRFSLR